MSKQTLPGAVQAVVREQLAPHHAGLRESVQRWAEERSSFGIIVFWIPALWGLDTFLGWTGIDTLLFLFDDALLGAVAFALLSTLVGRVRRLLGAFIHWVKGLFG